LILYVGFLGRPIGGYFFGRVGDKIGVHRLLFLSILGISISSLLIGIILGFSYSWLLLATLLFSQGIFTGAEQASAAVFVVQKTTYTASALLVSFGVLGVIAAQFVAYLMSLYPNSGFERCRFSHMRETRCCCCKSPFHKNI
jgi:MHS family proline/betaine transporter-like MFS transporter